MLLMIKYLGFIVYSMVIFTFAFWLGAWNQRRYDKELKKWKFKIKLCAKYDCEMDELHDRVSKDTFEEMFNESNYED